MSPYLQESTIRKLVADTFSIQHDTLNKGSSVNTIKEEWPFLFEAVHLFDHTSTLLGFLVQTKLAEEVSRKGTSIQNFLYSKGMKIGDSPAQLNSGIARYKVNPDQFFYQNESKIVYKPQIMITGLLSASNFAHTLESFCR